MIFDQKLILSTSMLCLVTMTLAMADDVETIIEDEGDGTEEIVTKEEKIVETVPAPPPPSSSVEIERIETDKVDVTGPDLVKLTKKIEAALNAVIAKVIQRKKEIAAHLRRFDQGMVNIIRLLGTVQTRRKRDTIETRHAGPYYDDGIDNDENIEEDIVNENNHDEEDEVDSDDDNDIDDDEDN